MNSKYKDKLVVEENGVELLDVRVTYDQNKEYGFMVATATVIYADRNEG